MINFNKNSQFRGKNDRRDDQRGDRQMHRATCADCGKPCEVPFKPSKDKPVFCSNCFQGERGSRDDSRGSRGADRGSRGMDRGSRGAEREKPTMHRAICDDCGNSCEVPFRPNTDKPVFCNECFGKGGSGSSSYSSPKKSFKPSGKSDGMNEKLDKIIILLEKMVSSKDEKAKKPVVEVAAKKVVEIKEVAAKKVPPKKATVAKKTAVTKKVVAKKAPLKKATATKKTVAKNPTAKKTK